MAVGKRIALMGLSMAAGIASYATVSDYARTPNLNKDVAVVSSAASVLLDYKGKNPTEATAHAGKILSGILKDSGLRTPEFSQLEGEVKELDEQLVGINNRNIYEPVIKAAGEKLRSFAGKNEKDGKILFGGIVTGLIGLVLGGIACLRDKFLD